jgi:hypothetical protein
MKSKYLILTFSADGLYTGSNVCKTKKEIVKLYAIPLYIVDKIITLNNQPLEYLLAEENKQNTHNIYKTVISQMVIYLIRPNLF